jgi:tagatose-1,6-bisphosphate aldolase non-catalytic subunit AgaZ/GatZ
MEPLRALIRRIIELGNVDDLPPTLLAVCPNSQAVLEAAILAASRNNAPMLFAATLNQVDRDGGYTGWTQGDLVAEIERAADAFDWSGPLYPCLDHGGPWLKDKHTLEELDLETTMQEVKASLTASLKAGYRLLHIDPTVDRTLPEGQGVPIDTVVDRTVELMVHAEKERARLGLPPVDYEVGTEEVHGGLADLSVFEHFLMRLHRELGARNLSDAWPVFIVAKVGTDLHTTTFDPETATRLRELVEPYGSLIKGHYTDWVENPSAYPASGVGGANVGPEFTAVEYEALEDLVAKETILCYRRSRAPSRFMDVLEETVQASGRWQKWIQPDERDPETKAVPKFHELSPARRRWLTQTGARYVWTVPQVIEARRRLYQNVALTMLEPHRFVVDRIAAAIDRYLDAFTLFDALEVL